MPDEPSKVIGRGQLQLGEVTIQVGVMLCLLAAITCFTAWWDPNFLSPFSLRSILRDTATWSLFAIGQAIVIISGGIDLSVGALMCLVGVITITLLQSELPLAPVFIFVLVLIFAASVGTIHGLLVCGLKLQPFLVTLCSLLIFRGLARVVTHDKTISFNPSDQSLLRELGGGAWFGVPVPVYVLVGFLVPLGLFMRVTVPGRHLFAIGSNLEAARYSGVRVNALRIFSYAICSCLAAVAGILEAGDVGSVPPSSAGLAYEMYGITGAVLGGCALKGGQGSLIGVVIGMAILRVLKSSIVFLEIDTYWTFAVTGFVLLTAVIADSLIRSRRRGG